MNTQMKTKSRKRSILGMVLTIFAVAGFFLIAIAFGAAQSIGAIAANVTGSLADLAKLITAGSYVAGFGFAVGAVLKFKAHKDNPQQIPVGTPIALIFIAAALIFLPAIFGAAGQTIFKSTSGQGTVTGVSTFS